MHERKVVMKVQDLLIKVQKAEEAVSKREATLVKQTARELKRREALVAKGVDLTGKHPALAHRDNNDLYLEICDWEDSKEAVENSKKVLEEKIRILNTWKDRLTEAKKKENLWIKEIPETMKAMQTELVARWDEYDLERKERLTTAYNELGWDKFIKEYSYSAYQMIHTTASEIHKENMKSAESLIMNLYSRIHAITGEVTDWDGIHYSGGALNGVVYGKLGSVRVESILAGGYNIQRLHVRVLVHEI